MQKQRFRGIPFLLLLIICTGIVLRFYHLKDAGVKFHDEAICYIHALTLKHAMQGWHIKHFLYWYPALPFWIFLGCFITGFSLKGALLWGAINGILCIPLFYIFCSSIAPKRIALLATIALAFNYYLVYYSRTNLPTGYGIFFFCILITLLGKIRVYTEKNNTGDLTFYYTSKQYLLFISTGIFLGILIHIRTDAGLFGVGMLFALYLAFLSTYKYSNIRSNFKSFINRSSFIFVILISAAISFTLFLVIFGLLDWINWDATKLFYKERYSYTHHANSIWGPYLLIFIYRLSSIPFWSIAIIGIINDIVKFGKINIYRRWCLIAFIGMTILLFKTGLSFPRAYVFLVVLMCFYWALGVEYLISLHFLHSKYTALILGVCLIAATFFGEFMLIYPLFKKKANYDRLAEYMASLQPGNIIGTHSWPMLEGLPFDFRKFLIYDLSKQCSSYKSFCLSLKYNCKNIHIRYMILDNNISYFATNSKIIQQFAVTNLPDVIFYNDYGDDWHTCMEAFQTPPIKDVFTKRIMLYDLSRPRKIPATPIPFLGSENMDEIFRQRWTRHLIKKEPK